MELALKLARLVRVFRHAVRPSRNVEAGPAVILRLMRPRPFCFAWLAKFEHTVGPPRRAPSVAFLEVKKNHCGDRLAAPRKYAVRLHAVRHRLAVIAADTRKVEKRLVAERRLQVREAQREFAELLRGLLVLVAIVLLVDVEILRCALDHAVAEDAQISPTVLALHAVGRMDPDARVPVLVLVAGKNQKVFVHGMMPDAPIAKRGRANRSLPHKLFPAPAHVVGVAHHRDVRGNRGEIGAQLVRAFRRVVAVGPDKPVAGRLAERLIARSPE